MLARISSCRSNPADVGPHLERTRPRGTVLAGGDMVAVEMEEVVDLVVGGEETLCLPGRFEALHLPFSSARRLVRILGPVVETLVSAVLDTRHQLLLRRTATAELVDDHARGARHWRFSSLRSRRVAARLSRRLWTSTS